MHRTKRFYFCWKNMMSRCYDKNAINYKDYGGRSIKVCKKWHKFENFMSDLFEDYEENVIIKSMENCTLDRINNNGNYRSNNIKWSSQKEQCNNRRYNSGRSVYYEFNGMKKNITDWARYIDFSETEFRRRIKKYGFEKAITMPINREMQRKLREYYKNK